LLRFYKAIPFQFDLQSLYEKYVTLKQEKCYIKSYIKKEFDNSTCTLKQMKGFKKKMAKIGIMIKKFSSELWKAVKKEVRVFK